MPPEDLLAPQAAPALSDEDILGVKQTPPISPLKDLGQGFVTGLQQSTQGRLAALAKALNDQEAAANLKPAEPNAPGAIPSNPESPFFKPAQAAGALLPDVAGMIAAPEAAIPAMIGEQIIKAPQDAQDFNEHLRQLKAAAPDDPAIQSLQELNPATHGLAEAAKVAAFTKLAPYISSKGLTPILEDMAGKLGPVGDLGRALTTRPGGFVANTAANTVGNLAMGDILDRATDPNYKPPQTPGEAALAAIPAGVFGAMGALHEMPPKVDTFKTGKINQPPPLPPLAEAAPELSLQPQTQAAAQTAAKVKEAKAPAPEPAVAPPVPVEPAPAPPTPAAPQPNAAEVLFPKPPPLPAEDPTARLGFLHDELEKTNPEALAKIQALAGRRDWSETEVLEALEKAVSDQRLADSQPPTEPKPDEQKRSQQESDVRGQAEQPAAQEPDTVNQLRQQPGNAVPDEGTGDQVRGQRLERPVGEGGPVPRQGEGGRVSPEPNPNVEVRGNGEQRPGAEEQPVLATVPETPDTLVEQQKALLAGQRPAMLFTKGEKPLKLPAGMKAVKDQNGNTWHYDPKKTTAAKIKAAVANGTENTLLELGSKSKAEVLASTPTPVGVVERTPGGTEVRAAVATPEGAPQTAAEMEPGKAPGNTIAVEHPATTMAGRGVEPEDLIAPRPGSLATPEGRAAVKSDEEKPSGKRPKKTIEEIEEDLNELNPSALADVQRERAANAWSDREYERTLKSRVYKEQKSQGLLPEAQPVAELPTKVKAVEKPKGPRRQTPEEKEQAIRDTIKDLQARAKAADKKGDQQGAANHLKEAAEWQEVLDANKREEEKDKTALKANEGEVGDEPKNPMEHAPQVQGEVNGFRAQFPEAPEMVVVHSSNLPHVLDPVAMEMFNRLDKKNGGKTRSFADPYTGKVYILHDRVGGLTPYERRLIYHEETFGHLGLEEAMRRSSGNEYGTQLDDAFNHLVADQGPQANRFRELVRTYFPGEDPHDVIADPVKRRAVMSEVLAHDTGKAIDKPWITQAITGLKRLIGKATGIDLTHHDDYMKRLVDAGVKHLREQQSEGADATHLSPDERQELRANLDFYSKKDWERIEREAMKQAEAKRASVRTQVREQMPAGAAGWMDPQGNFHPLEEGWHNYDALRHLKNMGDLHFETEKGADEVPFGKATERLGKKGWLRISGGDDGDYALIGGEGTSPVPNKKQMETLKEFAGRTNMGVGIDNGGKRPRIVVRRVVPSMDELRANVGPVKEADVDKDNQLKYSSLDGRLFPSSNQAGLQAGPHPQPAQSAEDFVRQGDAARTKDNRGVPGTFGERYRDQTRDLISWARDSGRILDPNSPMVRAIQESGLKGGEHRVVFDEASQRWLKQTLPEQPSGLRITGLTPKKGVSKWETGNKHDNMATPLDYLNRLRLQNELGDDIRVHGITFAEGSSHPSFIVSQPDYSGVKPTANDTVNKILVDRGMEKAGFVKIGDGEFYSPESRITLSDVHPRNVAVNKDGSIVPFDVVASRGDPNVEQNSREAMQRVQSGQVGFKTDAVRDFFDRGRPRPLEPLRANVGPTTWKDIAKEKMEDLARIHRRFDTDVAKIKSALPRGLDARDNEAANSGLRAENDVAAFVAMNGGAREKNSKEAIAQRESILPLVEAGFGKVTSPEEYGEAVDKLRGFMDRVNAALQSQDPNVVRAAERLKKPTEDALRTALTDSEKTMAWAGKVKQEFDAQHGLRVGAGLKPTYFDNYAKRILEHDKSDDTAYAIPGGGGAAGFDRAQNMARRFETGYDAMEQGKRLAEMDVAGLVGKGQVDTMKAVGNEQLFDTFRNMEVPGSGGRKVIADARKVWNPILNNGKGGLETKAPKGPYTAVDGPRGERLFVDKEFAHYFRNLLAPSYVRNNALLSGILHTAATMKHGVLLFDTFHVGRVMARLANLLSQARYGKGLANLDIPMEVLQKLGITENAKYGKGRALLDFREDTLNDAEKLGWVTKGDADWARQNQALLPLMEKTGYNVAGNLDNLYERSGAKGLIHQVLETLGKGNVNVGHGIETFNKWVFQKMTRNAMAIGWKEAFERNMKRFPEKSQMEVAQFTSKEMNEYFGNLGRQGIFKSATAQDLARMTFLAPQWANSMIASQARGVGQAVQLLHPDRRPGNVAGAMGAGYLAMFAANQLINQLTKGHPTWENEEGHKDSAFIPGGKNGFYLSPASIVGEELHTLMRYHEGGASLPGAAGRILLNKASPVARAAIAGVAGIDSMGRPIAPGKRLVTATRALNPLPIFTGAATGDLLNPEMAQKGDMQRQLFGMAGLKLDRAESAGQKLRSMAAKTIPDAFPKNESPGDYAPLRAYVNNENDTKAKAEILNLLRQGKTVAELTRVFSPKPIGGSAQRQAVFLQKRPDAVNLLEPAARERGASAERLGNIISSIPSDELEAAINEGTERLLK